MLPFKMKMRVQTCTEVDTYPYIFNFPYEISDRFPSWKDKYEEWCEWQTRDFEHELEYKLYSPYDGIGEPQAWLEEELDILFKTNGSNNIQVGNQDEQ